jgi:uncharacterized repeat protein (TIGR03803 family)
MPNTLQQKTSISGMQLCVGRIALAFAVMLVPATLEAQSQQAKNYHIMYTFTGGADGENSQGGVTRGSAGTLYGTTVGGGAYGYGTVFKVNSNGETVLHSFNGADGQWPFAPLIRDAAGNFYGTTYQYGAYGYGTVFKIDATGILTTLYSFMGTPDGEYPQAGLMVDAEGNLYGTTVGDDYRSGTVFKLDRAGTETVLHTFALDGVDGTTPYGGLTRDAAGNLYGTTYYGGDLACLFVGCGVVFELDTAGVETILHTFTGGADGARPMATLIRDAAGNLYGTTYMGGDTAACGGYGCGVIFKLDPVGTETVLYTFTGGVDGGLPQAGLTSDAAGNLYGTTSFGGIIGPVCSDGCGVVFKLDRSGTFTVLHHFHGGVDGAYPAPTLIWGSAGTLLGTTMSGGAYGDGTVFAIKP